MANPTPAHFYVPQGQPFSPAVAHFISQQHASLKNVTLIVPTKRAVATLTQAFAATLPSTAFLPRILPLNPEEAGFFPPQNSVPPLARLFFVYAQVKAKAAAEKIPLTAAQAFKTARDVTTALLTLRRHHITPQAFQSASAQNSLSAQNAGNTQLLHILLTHYPTFLKEGDYTDEADAEHAQFTAWAEHLSTQNTPLYAIGFEDTTRAGLIVLKSVSQKGTCIFPSIAATLKPEETPSTISAAHPVSQLLNTLNISLEHLTPLPTHIPAQTPTYSLTEAPDIETEAHTIALMLKESFVQKQRAMVVTPDPAFGAKIQTYLRTYGLEADDGAGIPLHKTQEGTLLTLIAHIFNAPDVTHLAALLQHPLLQEENLLAHRYTFDRLLLRGTPPTFNSWSAYAKKLTHVTHSFPKPTSASISAAQSVLTALTHIFQKKTGTSKNLTLQEKMAHITHAFSCLTNTPLLPDILEQLQNWETQSPEPTSWRHLADLLPEILSSTTIRTPVTSGLLIRGPLQARWETADRLIISHLNAGVWPAKPHNQVWISPSLAEALALPLPTLSLALGATHFTALTTHSPHIIFTRHTTHQGSELAPAPLLTQFMHQKNLNLNALTSSGNTYLHYLKTLTSQENIGTLNLKEDFTSPILDEKWSASFIGGLMQCPYKARLERFGRLTPLNPYNQEPDARDKGTRLHQALHAFFDPPPYPPQDLPPPFPEEITTSNTPAAAAHLMAQLTVFLRDLPPVTAALWRTRLATQTQHLMTLFAEHVTQGRQPKLFEKSGTLSYKNLTIVAHADRIDTTTEGAIILDYKTGEPPKWPDVLSGRQPQLLVEAWLAAAGAFGPEYQTVQAIEYWQISTGKKASKKPAQHTITEDVLTTIHTGLTHLIDHYTHTQTFPAVPAGRGIVPEGHCLHCDFAAICRFKNRLSS